jgi:hypothetical protein
LWPSFISQAFFSQALFFAAIQSGKFPGQAAAPFSFYQHLFRPTGARGFGSDNDPELPNGQGRIQFYGRA